MFITKLKKADLLKISPEIYLLRSIITVPPQNINFDRFQIQENHQMHIDNHYHNSQMMTPNIQARWVDL
jgi:hypothetical protein